MKKISAGTLRSRFQVAPILLLMSNKKVIIVLGSAIAGNKFADVARRTHNACVVEVYSPVLGNSTRLSAEVTWEYENLVIQQLNRARGGNSLEFDFVVFFRGQNLESYSFPFHLGSQFLGLSGEPLFRKLVVVREDGGISMDSEKQFAGLRVIDGCEPHQILAQIFVEDGKISLSQFYFDSARKTGRHHEEATILLVGHSGHGKSKTINRLIGYSLLEVGRGNNNLGSTTKDVQRVKMPVPQSDPQQPPIILGLDDTPGYGDNTSEDRGTNLALIRLYQERFYSPSIRIPWRRYPNVVLIVTSWNSLTIDAHNAPEKFTSPLGQSMFKVAQAGLVDPQRPNVIVVVTKSLSFMSEFDDYKTQAEKDEQWKIEAGRRRGIITDLQRKLFPKLAQWPIVFIENGGGKHVHHQYPMLPNGELSHQNLFEAIQCVIEGKGNEEASDLAGMQALQLLTGAEPFGKSFEPQKEILVDSTREQVSAVIEEPPISASKTQCSEQAQVLADQFLGVTYHPILGSYGRTTVLKLGASDVGFRKGHGAETYFTQIENLQEEKTATATRLGCDFDVPQLARLSAYYSTSEGVKQAWNNASQLYVAQHLLEQVAVNPLCPELSDAMLKAISKLPPWSQDSKDVRQCYADFFTSYGTHVVMRLALGGNIRIVTRNSRATDERSHVRHATAEAKLPVEELGMKVGTSAVRKATRSKVDASGKMEIRIFVDGGGAVAGEVSGRLENHFRHLPPEIKEGYPWPDDAIRTRWIKALNSDPAFCPDHTSTEYRWLHTLGGLSADQQRDLASGAEYYLRMWREEKLAPPTPQAGKKPVKDLPRKSNLERVKRTFRSLLFWRKKSSS